MSLDGSTGAISTAKQFRQWMLPSAASSAALWVGQISSAQLQVRTNADTPRDAKQAQ